MKKPLSLQDLDEQVKDNRARLLTRFREHYHYARELGFSSGEAQILQKQSKETILKLARERKASNA